MSMPKSLLWSCTALSLLAAPAFGADPSISLQDFQSVQANLAGQIDSFVASVKSCTMIPAWKNQVINKFSGSQPQSAKNSLSTILQTVNTHAAAADQALAAGCGAVNGAASSIISNLQRDLDGVKQGIAQANTPSNLTLLNGALTPCAPETKQMVPAMLQSNNALVDSLTAVRDAYAANVQALKGSCTTGARAASDGDNQVASSGEASAI